MIVSGTVVTGEARGRQLGFRTANIEVDAVLASQLEHGVYAGRALGYPAAVSVGVRPTFGDGLRSLVEVHILDFEGDLYGQHLDVELLRYLRPEVKFASVEALRDQIERDVAAIRVAAVGPCGGEAND